MYTCFCVTSHLFEVGSSSCHYVTHMRHIKEARPLVGKNAKMVVSCCTLAVEINTESAQALFCC